MIAQYANAQNKRPSSTADKVFCKPWQRTNSIRLLLQTPTVHCYAVQHSMFERITGQLNDHCFRIGRMFAYASCWRANFQIGSGPEEKRDACGFFG
jgi:hypothetical protein